MAKAEQNQKPSASKNRTATGTDRKTTSRKITEAMAETPRHSAATENGPKNPLDKPQVLTFAKVSAEMRQACLAQEAGCLTIAKLKAEMDSRKDIPKELRTSDERVNWKEWSEKNGVSLSTIQNATAHASLIRYGVPVEKLAGVSNRVAKTLQAVAKRVTEGGNVAKVEAIERAISELGSAPTAKKLENFRGRHGLDKKPDDQKAPETPKTPEQLEQEETAARQQAAQDALLRFQADSDELRELEDGLTPEQIRDIAERVKRLQEWVIRASGRAKVGKVDAFTSAQELQKELKKAS